MIINYWSDDFVESAVTEREHIIKRWAHEILSSVNDQHTSIRGIGLIYGIEFKGPDSCAQTIKLCFKKGLVIENCGSYGQVLKLMPAISLELPLLVRGLKIIENALTDVSSGMEKKEVASEEESVV